MEGYQSTNLNARSHSPSSVVLDTTIIIQCVQPRPRNHDRHHDIQIYQTQLCCLSSCRVIQAQRLQPAKPSFMTCKVVRPQMLAKFNQLKVPPISCFSHSPTPQKIQTHANLSKDLKVAHINPKTIVKLCHSSSAY